MENRHLIVGILYTACALLIGGLSIPLIMKKVKRNRCYGFRFAKTYESEALWTKINRYGGKQFLYWSVLVLAVGIYCLLAPEMYMPHDFIIGSVPFLYLVPAVQVYLYANKL